MADEIDRANEIMAEHNESSLSAHRAARGNQIDQPSAKICVDCLKKIPELRRRLVKGCQRCISCQTDLELENSK